jgi:putative transposase
MPNHLHGILVIVDTLPATEMPCCSVSRAKGGRLAAGSLGAIIGQLKSARTKRIWAAGTTDFAWQSRFHDHIIRDDESLQRIRT